jgi:hypothetical protein
MARKIISEDFIFCTNNVWQIENLKINGGLKMEGTIFALKDEYVDEIKRLDDDETRKLMIELVESKKELEALETGDTMVRLINNGETIEVRKVSKISFYDIR